MVEYFNIHGIDTYTSPLQATQDGQLIHSVNMVSMPYGAKSKRPGYTTFLGTPDTNQINSLVYYPQQNANSFYLYRASGSLLYYSAMGTGAWTVVQGSAGGDAGGTITNGNHIGYTIVNNVFIMGDGAGSTRHTTVGSVMTNTSLAPVSAYFAQFQGRAYSSNGTNSVLSFSVANDATNWNTGGTSDSSSFIVPSEGALGTIFVAADKLISTKTKGKMFSWDGYQQIDLSKSRGPSSPYSVDKFGDYWNFINQYGHYGFDGATTQLMSNAAQRQFYNRQNTGIAGTLFTTIPAAVYIHDYYMAIGTVTDDFTGRQIGNAILKYNYQQNEYLNWQFNDNPTAWCVYTDTSNLKQLIFGNASGQCFQLSPTATSDNGKPIQTEMVYLFTYAAQSQSFSQTSASSVSGISYEKKWDWIRLFFNPGNEVNIQYAFSNTLTYQHLKWSEAINTKVASGDYWQISDGVVEIRFPVDPNNLPRSRFLFVRIYDDSDSSEYTYYGCEIEATPQVVR